MCSKKNEQIIILNVCCFPRNPECRNKRVLEMEGWMLVGLPALTEFDGASRLSKTLHVTPRSVV